MSKQLHIPTGDKNSKYISYCQLIHDYLFTGSIVMLKIYIAIACSQYTPIKHYDS